MGLVKWLGSWASGVIVHQSNKHAVKYLIAQKRLNSQVNFINLGRHQKLKCILSNTLKKLGAACREHYFG